MKKRIFQCIQWTINRSYSGYVTVKRPTGFKTVTSPKEEVSSLAKALHLKIKAGGPITVADYMRTCLTNPSVGYYIHKNGIGRDGDFITSPEISELFGEMIGVWIANTLEKIGGANQWQIIELGPGKGTLMSDILRTLNVVKCADNLSVHLVEVSQQMARIQAQCLCNDSAIGIGMMPKSIEGEAFYLSGKNRHGVPVYWYEKLEKVPNAFSVVLAHEFFDALPIHKFQKFKNEWREVLINSTLCNNGKYEFNYVLSEKESPIWKSLIDENEKRDHIEVSPEAGAIAADVARRMEAYGGFSLFIDYGHNGEKTDTFRGFREHKLVDPLVDPGMADITADVDFSFLRRTMQPKAYMLGPVEQRHFLRELKIGSRMEILLQQLDKKVAGQVLSNIRLFMKKHGMGSRYKCFAAFPLVLERHLLRHPLAGFLKSE